MTAFTDADAVVHLAWRIQPGYDERAMRRTNADGSRQVTATGGHLRGGAPGRGSSVGAYSPGSKDAPIEEDWPTSRT
jgi:UDP-glucose 4-epimerase